MFRIDKTFEFCYGHRVWSQELNGEYADDLKCACRHLHGHEAKVQVYLESEALTRGMVTDFRHLEWLKKWLNKHVDHRFIIDRADPLFNHLFGGNRTLLPVTLDNQTVGWQFDTSASHGPTLELVEGVLVVEFVPTSEHLSEWLHGIVDRRMAPLDVRTVQVDWWETPKSKSSYRV